jgi:BNR repeat-like domain
MKKQLETILILLALQSVSVAFAQDHEITANVTPTVKYYTLSPEQEADRQFGLVFGSSEYPITAMFEYSRKEIGPSVVRSVTFNIGDNVEIVEQHDFKPSSSSRLSPLGFSSRTMYLSMNLAVYDFFDRKTQKFKWKNSTPYTSILGADLAPTSTLGQYTIPFSEITLCGRTLTAYYDYSDHWVAGVYFGDNFDTKLELRSTRFQNLQEPELVLTGPRSAIVLLRAPGAGMITYAKTDDCGKTFTDVKASEIPSPASMVRALERDGRIIILHNRIKSTEMGPRNRLDITITDLNMRELCTVNLIKPNKTHLFSNFDMRWSGPDNLIAGMQSYRFASAKDSVGLIVIPVKLTNCPPPN